MNAAVLMFTTCLAGPGQVPTPMPPAGPAPVVVYPGQGYVGGYAGGYAGGYGHGHFGNGCGHATVDCCGEDKCCLLKKIKDKLCCVRIHITCEKKQSCCDKGPVCHNPCPKPVCHNPCPKPVCNPCPKPVCNPCPKPACEKPTCCKVEPTCHKPCTSVCWTPGYCLHKCKEKLGGLCHFGDSCHGGCGTAATPNACGSSVIAPAPGTVVPAPPTPAPPKAMPDVKKIGSNYGIVRPELTPVAGTAPRVIDLTPSPF